MSYFDDASLVMIPSGYKTSKVYSVKPTDGSGDLTFSRSNDTATRVNSAGLIEKVRTNLILQSQALATTWVTFQPSGGGTITRTNNYATAPDGTMTATRIVNTGSSPFQWVYQNFTHPNNTLSVWAKSTSGSNQTFRLFGSNGGLNSANFTATNTWQRFTFSVSGISTVEPLGIAADSSGNAYDILFWGFQFETGDVATDYIATTTAAVSVGPVANVPRLDYLGSSCPRLLLEPQRTNLKTYSEDGTGTNWGNPYEVSATANQIASPDGYVNADSVADTANNTAHRFEPSFNATNGTAYTFSYFAKANTLTQCHIYGFTDNLVFSGQQAIFNLSNGTIVSNTGGGTAAITPYGNGWYRVSLTLTANATSLGYFGFGPAKNGAVSYLGNGSSLYMWGVQLEAGAYATSYIPTLGAAVTRGADAASKTGISSLIGQTEGTLFFDVTLDQRASYTYFVIAPNIGSVSTYIGIAMEATRLNAEIVNSGVQASIAFTNSSTGRFKAALAYKANDVAFYVNGTLVGTDTSATIPACSQLALNNYDTNAAPKYNQALVFKTRLSNADLAALTA